MSHVNNQVKINQSKSNLVTQPSNSQQEMATYVNLDIAKKMLLNMTVTKQNYMTS